MTESLYVASLQKSNGSRPSDRVFEKGRAEFLEEADRSRSPLETVALAFDRLKLADGIAREAIRELGRSQWQGLEQAAEALLLTSDFLKRLADNLLAWVAPFRHRDEASWGQCIGLRDLARMCVHYADRVDRGGYFKWCHPQLFRHHTAMRTIRMNIAATEGALSAYRGQLKLVERRIRASAHWLEAGYGH